MYLHDITISIMISDIIINLKSFEGKKTITISIFSKFFKFLISFIYNSMILYTAMFIIDNEKNHSLKFDKKITSIINIIL